LTASQRDADAETKSLANAAIISQGIDEAYKAARGWVGGEKTTYQAVHKNR
jgi:hypothetical protein